MPRIVAKKRDWIKLGYKLFAEQGLFGIVVEKMAKELRCNKSSFYWHFKTKKEFIYQIAIFWMENETKKIITMTDGESSVAHKLDKLIEITYKKMPFLDFTFYLKRYAIKEQRVSEIIDEVNELRVNYVQNLLTETGYSQKEAKIRASLLYKHLIGYHEMMRYKDQGVGYVAKVKNELSIIITY